MNKTEILFINHASCLISYKDISILSDPWYEGSSFNDGWNLLFENDDKDIRSILSRTNYIWISHEHPDHFSIPFFKKYKDFLKENKIKILFQKTKDKRVLSFISSLNLCFIELDPSQEFKLDNLISIKCFKEGFYDSSLYIETPDMNILNLNDCEIRSSNEAKKIRDNCKNIDVMLTQFSYAAWKGGRNNIEWRKKAAKEKLKTISFQAKYFSPKFIIPFASFFYFSNKDNFYLNDSSNSPENVISNGDYGLSRVIVMKPNDIFDGKENVSLTKNAIEFWNKRLKIQKNNNIILNNFNSYSFDDLNVSFKKFIDRIQQKNNIFLMKIVKTLLPFNFFQPIVFHLNDIDELVEADILNKTLMKTSKNPDISLHTNSLMFIFKNSFGFDTLTVNGCFEEKKKGAFLKFSKSFALENLNNLGINFSLLLIINFRIYTYFFRSLSKVSKNL